MEKEKQKANEAFLLPESPLRKRDLSWKDATKEEVESEALPSISVKYSIDKSYTLEQIGKAIDETMPHKYQMAWDNERFKNLFFKNLTK